MLASKCGKPDNTVKDHQLVMTVSVDKLAPQSY